MPNKFRYTAVDSSGNTITDTLSADSPEHLMAQIHAKNLFCMGYEEIGVNTATAAKLNTKSLVIFCRQLGTMLNAGIPISLALHLIQDKVDNLRAKKVFSQLYEDVQKGNSLSIAMQLQPGMFPNLLVNMILAGEAGGTLDSAMNRMADHFDKENKLQNKIKQALVYPVILSVISVLVVLVLVTFVLPTITNMFDAKLMPPTTKFLIGVSSFLIHQWYIVLIGLVVLIVGIKLLFSMPAFKYEYDRILLHMPIIGKLNRTIYSARCARTFASLYLSGVQALDMIEITGKVLGNSFLVKRFDEVITSVSRGEFISKAIAETKSFDPMLSSMLYIGEESGSLGDILLKTADYFDGESETALQRMIALIEPLMLVIMGVIIAFIVISIMQPIFTMYNTLGNS
ncbi:MAG: type II secretion system F family protein [Erysipelotrichaceae bacterium]|nr:type II secretion system F family protein [Erysipelotrichaceae bacterium]